MLKVEPIENNENIIHQIENEFIRLRIKYIFKKENNIIYNAICQMSHELRWKTIEKIERDHLHDLNDINALLEHRRRNLIILRYLFDINNLDLRCIRFLQLDEKWKQLEYLEIQCAKILTLKHMKIFTNILTCNSFVLDIYSQVLDEEE